MRLPALPSVPPAPPPPGSGPAPAWGPALAWDEGRPLLEHLKSDPEVTRHLDPAEIEACFDPARYLEHSDVIFRRLESL